MSFATARSQLQQLQRSTLQQRGTFSGPLFQSYQSLVVQDINSSNTTDVPPTPDVGHYGLENAAIPWSILHVTPDPPFDGTNSTANYWRFYTDDVQSNQAWNVAGGTFDGGGNAGGNLSQCFERFYGFPILSLPAPGTTFPLLVMGARMCFWIWGDALPTGRGGVKTGPGYVYVNWQRDRLMYNKPSGGFMFRCELWARKRSNFSVFGWDPTDPRDALNFHGSTLGAAPVSIENASLYRPYSVTPAFRFKELPYDFPGGALPGTLAGGFLGQGIFAIDWETPAQFSARTGIVIH